MDAEPGFRALLIDDNPEDRLFAERLTEDGLPCTGVVPDGSLEELRMQILDAAGRGDADVVLMDYRLDDRSTQESRPFAHRAGALAAELKEHQPSLPIVLVTTEGNLQEWVRGNRTIAPLFDMTVLKSQLALQESRQKCATSIRDLTRGYRRLVQIAKGDLTWESVARGLGLAEDEADTFAGNWPDPPPQGLPDLVAAVLKGLMAERPGLLLPYPDAAARLGISPESLDQLLHAAPDLRYEGPFSVMAPRVWRSRIDAAIAAVSPDGTTVEDGYEDFANAMEHATVQFCRVCGKTRASRACALCRQGVDQRHFVVASELVKPAWSDPRAVCFNCIEEGDADEERFLSASRTLVERLRAEGWHG